MCITSCTQLQLPPGFCTHKLFYLAILRLKSARREASGLKILAVVDRIRNYTGKLRTGIVYYVEKRAELAG